jgi:hypothetical protein
MATDDVQHHVTPEIVINKDPLCPAEKQIMLVNGLSHGNPAGTLAWRSQRARSRAV